MTDKNGTISPETPKKKPSEIMGVIRGIIAIILIRSLVVAPLLAFAAHKGPFISVRFGPTPKRRKALKGAKGNRAMGLPDANKKGKVFGFTIFAVLVIGGIAILAMTAYGWARAKWAATHAAPPATPPATV